MLPHTAAAGTFHVWFVERFYSQAAHEDAKWSLSSLFGHRTEEYVLALTTLCSFTRWRKWTDSRFLVLVLYGTKRLLDFALVHQRPPPGTI